MEHLRYKPNRLWTLDSATPFADRSGYGVNATLTGSSTNALALSRYAAFSKVVNSTNYITFPQNVYIAGKEWQNFSLMASVFLPETGGTGDQQIMSNLSRSDGLYINGNTVFFATAYATQGFAICSYQLPVNKKVDVVGVHMKTKNLLYVDGVLVDSIDITAAQQVDAYATTDGNLYAGRLNAENLLINTVATYPRALNDDEILTIYNGNNVVSAVDPFYFNGGDLVPISTDARAPYLNISIDTKQDWNEGVFTATWVNDDGYLRPEMIGTQTMAGTWVDNVNIYASGSPSAINSIYLFWDGKNVLVETSVNGGTTWVTATRGVNLSNVTTGFDPTGTALLVRATFTGNVTDAYLGKLRIVGYLGTTGQPPNGRLITYTNPVTLLPDQVPAQMREDWGAKIQGGTLTIDPDSTSTLPSNVGTVELWIRQLTGTAPTFSANLTTGTTQYVNGLAGSTIRRGEWTVVHFSKATNITGAITVSGNVQVGRVVLYFNQLSAGAIANGVSNYTGRVVATRAAGGPVTVFEPAASANVYSHDWANV